ncbi:uncharacterized protein B0P05DRAFT_610344 [Gilbertella persicaria]|uniref:uncharacterized protein n=1 Tax=Gilbertella persicaria TaxID=101096 RepID=UPI0022204352|nr:uncharacterized protein B0P05DRAFT_610330 [Gilbertella persicaria]XP_051436032.1 uncharacterized protein B0P05DRAFT_610344 [Gilbertella persicaria]KAI8083226.1 hypothetical protein B0P05DRAFT_610330 [Gilbertella persicaria]KAI8083227.1 hypothetical protein B0P05DRAFT_610344 [Gilbertella persicaria]
MQIDATSVTDLHGAWFERFAAAYKEAKKTKKEKKKKKKKKKKPPKGRRYSTVIWNEIYSSFIHIKKTYNKEAPSPAAKVPNSVDTNNTRSLSANKSTPLSLTLRIPGQDRFYVEQIDISERFYNMQKYVYNFVKHNHLTMESDVHLILSLSLILLLQNNNRLHKDMVWFFGDKVYH